MNELGGGATSFPVVYNLAAPCFFFPSQDALLDCSPWKCVFKISKLLDILIGPVVDPFCFRDYAERTVKGHIKTWSNSYSFPRVIDLAAPFFPSMPCSIITPGIGSLKCARI